MLMAVDDKAVSAVGTDIADKTAGDDGASGDVMIAFSPDDDCLATMRRLANQEGLPEDNVRPGAVDELLEWLRHNPPPHFSLVDVSGEPDAVEAIRDIYADYGGDTLIVAIGADSRDKLASQAEAAGAHRYLAKPLREDDVADVLELTDGEGTQDSTLSADEGTLITFIGARGGVGASTLAVNYAYALSHLFAKEETRVLAVDFDLEYGSLSLHLNLDPGKAMKTALTDPERVDSHFLSSAFSAYNETLSVLSADVQVGEDIEAPEDAADMLVQNVLAHFSHVVCDLPRHHLLDFPGAAIMAQKIFLVSDLSLVGLRDTLRLRAALERSGCKGEMRVVINDLTGGEGQVESAQFARALGMPIDFHIPYEESALNRALNAGKPLFEVSPDARMVTALKEMAGVPAKVGTDTVLTRVGRWLAGD